MVKFLYKDFLDDRRIYNLAQGSWNRVLNSILKDRGYTYKPYINQLHNGQKEYNGNPIFSAYIPEIKRAIRIIQVSHEAEGDDISAWIDRIPSNDKIPETEELVIDIKLSKKAKDIAKEILNKWISNELDVSYLDRILK